MKGVSFDFVNSATPFSLNFRKYLPANILYLTLQRATNDVATKAPPKGLWRKIVSLITNRTNNKQNKENQPSPNCQCCDKVKRSPLSCGLVACNSQTKYLPFCNKFNAFYRVVHAIKHSEMTRDELYDFAEKLCKESFPERFSENYVNPSNRDSQKQNED